MREYDKKLKKIIPIRNGLGDNIIVNKVLSDLMGIYGSKKIIIGTAYPQVYNKTKSIATMDILQSLEYEKIDKFNIYRFMFKNVWTEDIESAYVEMFTRDATKNKTVLISPYSKKLKTSKNNAKNYPYFKELVRLLKDDGIKTIQVGIEGEDSIGCDEDMFDLSIDNLTSLIEESYSWISVDNFFHHLAWTIGKRGNVIFGPSDPSIYGHSENNNILRNKRYMVKNQFDVWENIVFNELAFDEPNKVFEKLDFT